MYGYESRVRFSEVNEQREMTLVGVLNHFQDCSIFHSEDLEVGVDYLAKHERMWLLSSWNIEISRYPKLGETIRVETWPYAFGRMYGNRNFRMLDVQGNPLAWADTQWVFMDTKRKRPTRVDDFVGMIYGLDPRLPMDCEEGHIAIPEQPVEEESFQVHSVHLDVNHHVNNGQYVQMAAGFLPKDFVIKRMRAEYKKQAVLGDTIHPLVEKRADGCTVVLADEAHKPYAVVEFR